MCNGWKRSRSEPATIVLIMTYIFHQQIRMSWSRTTSPPPIYQTVTVRAVLYCRQSCMIVQITHFIRLIYRLTLPPQNISVQAQVFGCKLKVRVSSLGKSTLSIWEIQKIYAVKLSQLECIKRTGCYTGNAVIFFFSFSKLKDLLVTFYESNSNFIPVFKCRFS